MAYANGYAVVPDDAPAVWPGDDVAVLMVDWEHPED